MNSLLRKVQANPKLADRKDDDERLPIHWAVSYGHLDIAVLLSAGKTFDPDVQVSLLGSIRQCPIVPGFSLTISGRFRMDTFDDSSLPKGWRTTRRSVPPERSRS